MENIVILDIGSYTIKYGYAGYDKPLGKIRTAVYTDDITISNNINVAKDYLVDLSDEYINGLPTDELKYIHYPVKCSAVINYDYLMPLFDEIFENLNKKYPFNPNKSYVLICDPLNSSDKYKKELTDIMFTNYKFKGIQFASQHILSVYGNARSKGIVIDLGHENTRIVPVYDNYIITEAVMLTNPIKNNDDVTIDNLVDSIKTSISKIPLDLRKQLTNNVLLIGGNSMKKNLGKSLQKKLTGSTMIFPKNRDNIIWTGGSILCMLPTFNNWIINNQ